MVHNSTVLDLEASDARAAHLAAIARRALFDYHSWGKHRGSITTCRQCAGDWVVATAVIER
ncbi:hypothetical protein SAMN05660642_00051 [Geodermatophilus siccatus]|uniref:Uncharacterized protein n=1 Tax=Geodermatophilus siccatus TaxID=1137991 RepID=A0A1G9KJS2_9ACTN|nr:hypothetical protein [Geodermatophilus siccatus]SDL49909.1 hypothetical protein SAMN05660642_00051 [Geodermatophilus siccatus]